MQGDFPEMKWLYTLHNDEAINTDNICHIWIENSPNGFFLMGEMMHSGEEVVLSGNCKTEKECQELLKATIFRLNGFK